MAYNALIHPRFHAERLPHRDLQLLRLVGHPEIHRRLRLRRRLGRHSLGRRRHGRHRRHGLRALEAQHRLAALAVARAQPLELPPQQGGLRAQRLGALQVALRGASDAAVEL